MFVAANNNNRRDSTGLSIFVFWEGKLRKKEKITTAS